MLYETLFPCSAVADPGFPSGGVSREGRRLKFVNVDPPLLSNETFIDKTHFM